MNYKEFSDNVTATAAAKKAVDEFAAIQTDGVHFCPRCGRMSVKDRLCTNALSRHVHCISAMSAGQTRPSTNSAAMTCRYGSGRLQSCTR